MRKYLMYKVFIAIVVSALVWQWENLPPCSTDAECYAMHGY